MTDLLSRLRDARLFRALALFFASAWVALQVAAFTIDRFGFPDWTLTVTLVLLGIGLAVIIGVAAMKARVARLTAEGSGSGAGLRRFTWRRAASGGAMAFLVLFGLAGLWVVIQDRGRSFAPDDALAEAAPAVAVLPFEATGPGLESWREGAIDLISTNLDGAGGLRAIDSRTVLARWTEGVKEGERPDVETSLGVARHTGAQYAILGNVVALGVGIRLTADVHRLDDGRKLGTAQVEGAPDSVYQLVDRLSIDILREILGETEEFPRVELARATTSSLLALRAYLEGEGHFRRADFEPAVEAYRRAVAADSTFALAWRRLGESIGWLPAETRPEEGPYHAAMQAVRYADRLPEREAMAVRAYAGFIHGTFRPILEPLRTAVRRYPDDPELQFLLAELYVHMGDQIPVSREEMSAALDRTLELDPHFAPYYQHPIEGAFFAADSARAIDLLERYARIAHDNLYLRGYRLAADVAWGDPARRAAALAAIDTLPTEDLPLIELRHPRFVEYRDRVAAAAGRGGIRTQAAFGLLAAGRPDAARIELAEADPRDEVGILYRAQLVGAPGVEERLREMTRDVPDSVWPASHYRAALAAEAGNPAAVERLARSGRAYADSLRAEGDSLSARGLEGVIRALEGYARFRGGDRDGGLQLLIEGQRDATGWGPMVPINDGIRIWIARALVDLGRLEEALGWYETFDVSHPWIYPWIALETGTVYERLGRREEAKTRYETALAYWRNAGPEMQPKVAEARAGLARLGFAPRG